MKRNIVYSLMCAVLISMALPCRAENWTRSQIVSYASTLRGKKKAELKTAIHNLCQPDKVLEYGSGSGKTWSGFVQTDRIGTTLECRNRYSTARYYFASASSTSAISGMNIEHSFPKSWWGGSSNNAYKDLFNLYPSESNANSSKSNYPMGKVTNASILDSYEKVGKGTAGSLGTINLCEPNDTWKGDFCRSYFYMATIYQNLTWSGTQGLQQLENDTWPTLREWAYTLYLEWTRKDKVTDIEVDRNNAIYTIQNNRNLFIDYPNLAEYVWGDSVDIAFDPASSITSASDDSRWNGGATPSITVSAPAFSVASGTYTSAQSVTIGCSTSGATIYYTTDGSTPTSSSNKYTGAITISETTALKAIAILNGTSSSVATANYTISSGEETEGDYFWAETFSRSDGTGGNDDSWSGSIAGSKIDASYADNSGWTLSNSFAGDECIKLGTGSNQGSATSPSICGLNGKTFTLSFKAGAWNSSSEGTTLNVTATNCDISASSFTLAKGAWTTFTITVSNVTGDVQFTFKADQASKNRFFLDEINIPRESIIDPAEDYIACAILDK